MAQMRPEVHSVSGQQCTKSQFDAIAGLRQLSQRGRQLGRSRLGVQGKQPGDQQRVVLRLIRRRLMASDERQNDRETVKLAILLKTGSQPRQCRTVLACGQLFETIDERIVTVRG